MPLEDVVSPVIAAFLAGRKIKQDKERLALETQREADESKLRQKRAQQMEKELSVFDEIHKHKMLAAQNEEQASFIAKRSAIAKAVRDGEIPVEMEDSIVAALNTEPNIPGAIGLATKRRAFANMGGGERVEIQTPQQQMEQQAANALAMNAPKAALFKANADVTTGNQLKVQDDAQAFQTENREDTQTFTSGENEKTRLSRVEEAKLRLKAQENEGRLNRASHWGIAEMQQTGANERAQLAIDAKNMTDSDDVNNYVDTNVMNSLTSKERIAGLSKPYREAVYANAAKKGVMIHDEKQISTLNDLQQLNKIYDKVERISRMIGNGAEITTVTGGLTELGKELKALEVYKPVLAKLTSVKGTQSDQDTKIAAGNLVETWGTGVKAENERRKTALLEMQADLFLEQFPEGTNLTQIERAAKRFNINPKALKAVHERDKQRKAEGKK